MLGSLGIQQSVSGEMQDCILAKIHAEQPFAVSRRAGSCECCRGGRDLTQAIDLTLRKKQLADGRQIKFVSIELNIAQGMEQVWVCCLLVTRFITSTKGRIAKRSQHFRTRATTGNLLAQ